MRAKPTSKRGAVLLELGDQDEKLLASPKPETPFRIRNVLVPIDFSECSRKALRYALAFAKEHEAGITLLYVVSTNFAMGEPSSMEYVQFTSELRLKSQKELQTLAAAEAHGEVIAQSVVRVGSPSAEIVHAAATLPADMIVISTHGRTGLKHLLIGSVAEQVVRRAPCPVLVVREHEHECVAGA